MTLPPPPPPRLLQCRAPPTSIASVGDPPHPLVALPPHQHPLPPPRLPPRLPPPPPPAMVATVHRPSLCIRMVTIRTESIL